MVSKFNTLLELQELTQLLRGNPPAEVDEMPRHSMKME